MHNTQWVPGHFHFYLMLGLVPLLMGIAALRLHAQRTGAESALDRAAFWTYGVAGVVFCFVFLAARLAGRAAALRGARRAVARLRADRNAGGGAGAARRARARRAAARAAAARVALAVECAMRSKPPADGNGRCARLRRGPRARARGDRRIPGVHARVGAASARAARRRRPCRISRSTSPTAAARACPRCRDRCCSWISSTRNCPTYCAALGSVYAQLRQRLADEIAAGRVRLVSISFDPARDGPAELRGLPRALQRPIRQGWDLGRPAHTADLERWLKAFGVVVIADGMGGYTHNAAVHVVGPDRRLAAIHGLDDIDAIVAKVRAVGRNRRKSCCQPLIHPAPCSPAAAHVGSRSPRRPRARGWRRAWRCTCWCNCRSSRGSATASAAHGCARTRAAPRRGR